MKILFPNFHYDLLKQMSYIFQEKLKWHTCLLGVPEFSIFGIEKAMSDPDGYSRVEQQSWIAKSLKMELCTDADSVINSDIIIVSTYRHYIEWKKYALNKNIKAKIIYYCGNGDIENNQILSIKNLWTANKNAYNLSTSKNKLYWQGILAETEKAYTPEPTSESHHGFSCYINRLKDTYPTSFEMIEKSNSIYKKIGGREKIYLYGQNNPDGMLHMGKYYHNDEVLEKMKSSIAILHIKTTDAPGFSLMRALLLGKPLIVTEMFLKNTKMHNILNKNTCFITDSENNLANTLLQLERNYDIRKIGIKGSCIIRELCNWDIFSKTFMPWLEKITNE